MSDPYPSSRPRTFQRLRELPVVGRAADWGLGPRAVSERTERAGARIAGLKVTESPWQTFLRGVGCNWLVCLAVWMSVASRSAAGKVVVIFFPIMAFVARGFDHVVANMFFIPAAIFADVPDITWWDAVHNWIFAFIGNVAGAIIFVAGAYWFLYAREAEEEPGDTPSGAPERAPREPVLAGDDRR